jgi:hypothetical protein
MVRSVLLAVVVFGVSIQFLGCLRDAVRDSSSLMGANTENIVVTTKDGHRYTFAGGQYSVQKDSTGVEVLSGKGKLYRGRSNLFDRFEGSIPFAEVENVTVSEITPWFYFSLGMVTGFVTFAVLLAVSLHGLRVG